MALPDLELKALYNHSNCPDMITGLYEPLLCEAVRYGRTTYTFTAKGLIAAAAGTAGLIQNGGRIRLICETTRYARTSSRHCTRDRYRRKPPVPDPPDRRPPAHRA